MKLNTLLTRIKNRKTDLRAEIKEGNQYLKDFRHQMTDRFYQETYHRIQRRKAALRELVWITSKKSSV